MVNNGKGYDLITTNKGEDIANKYFTICTDEKNGSIIDKMEVVEKGPDDWTIELPKDHDLYKEKFASIPAKRNCKKNSYWSGLNKMSLEEILKILKNKFNIENVIFIDLSCSPIDSLMHLTERNKRTMVRGFTKGGKGKFKKSKKKNKIFSKKSINKI